MKKNWNDYVRSKLQEKGLTQEDVAEAIDKTQGTVGHWLTGRRSPNFSDVAKILEVAGEDKVILNSDGTIEDFDSNVKLAAVNKKIAYPLLSSVQAGIWTDTCDYADSTGYEMISSEVKAAKGSFFLEIKGTSMEPKFSEGDLVLIEINRRPHPGEFVAAINDQGEATFKQYKELGEISPSGDPHFELIPLNTVFPTISSKAQNIRIVGVAVEHRSYL